MDPRYGADVRWSPEDEAFVAVCPELGGLSALGATPHAAVGQLETVVQLAVTTYDEEGRPLPDPRVAVTYSGQFRVRLPRSLHAWLVREAEREGVSLNSFVMARLSEARGDRSGSHPNVATCQSA